MHILQSVSFVLIFSSYRGKATLTLILDEFTIASKKVVRKCSS